MFAARKYVLLHFIFFLLSLQKCHSLGASPSLVLYSPGEAEYWPATVRRRHDNLTLLCELRNAAPRRYLWSRLGDEENAVHQPLEADGGTLLLADLQPSDSGLYICSAPPFSVTKYILVQTRAAPLCARSALSCETRCVLPAYLCDGRRDCVNGEDEGPSLCQGETPCAAPDRLNCSSGRCIPTAACCRPGQPLCRQPYCCQEQLPTVDGYVDVEYPALYEDRHAPDDYSFIQSTIYTVTACALIFMIAVVLLISAVCKMHMKRSALRSYRPACSSRPPPCYEASRLLEQRQRTPPASPLSRQPRPAAEPRGLARLGALFTTSYTQVPSQCMEVELQPVRARGSPRRGCCELAAADLYLAGPSVGAPGPAGGGPSSELCATDLCLEDPEVYVTGSSRPRPLTLQLGRFHLSIGRLRRPRPDTPTVTEDLDLRLNPTETYSLNGRTIRLLGASFEDYRSAPPPYNEAVLKLYGPPPEYLSTDALNDNGDTVVDDNEASCNVEMPPRYEDLASGGETSCNRFGDNGNRFEDNGESGCSDNRFVDNGGTCNRSEDNGVSSGYRFGDNVIGNSNSRLMDNVTSGNAESASNNSIESSRFRDNVDNDTASSFNTRCNEAQVITVESNGNNNMTLTAVMDNLPAIDSDVNANDTVIRSNDIDVIGNGINVIIDNGN